jgi:hypothetical protein
MSRTSGDDDLGRGRGPERTVDVGATLPEPSTRVQTIYDDIREVLLVRGWVQGRQTRAERLSLTAAIDVVVGVDVETRAASGHELARSARAQRHLGELAGSANLDAWNDDGSRNMGDVLDLLRFAAIAYPED